jgi:hypothetical protein
MNDQILCFIKTFDNIFDNITFCIKNHIISITFIIKTSDNPDSDGQIMETPCDEIQESGAGWEISEKSEFEEDREEWITETSSDEEDQGSGTEQKINEESE